MSGFNDQPFRKCSSSKLMILHKLRHVSQVDKEIRRNWKNLFRILNGKSQIDPDLPKSRLHTVHTDVVGFSSVPQAIKERKSLGKLVGLHSEINREKVQNKKKENQQIFFKKKERKNKQTKKKQWQLCKSDVKLSPSKSGEKSQKKLILQPRREKLIREMGIIQKKYTQGLHHIQQKGNMKMSLNAQDQQQLVKRLRGNKLYYKFLSEWNTNKQDIF